MTKKSITYEREAGDRLFQIRLTLLNWDILGQKNFSRLHPVTFQGASGALVVLRGDRADGADSLRLSARAFTDVVGPVPIVFLLNVKGPNDAASPATAGLDRSWRSSRARRSCTCARPPASTWTEPLLSLARACSPAAFSGPVAHSKKRSANRPAGPPRAEASSRASPRAGAAFATKPRKSPAPKSRESRGRFLPIRLRRPPDPQRKFHPSRHMLAPHNL